MMSPANAGRYGRLTRNVPLIKNAQLDEEQKMIRCSAPNSRHRNRARLRRAQDAADWRERWDREVKFKLR